MGEIKEILDEFIFINFYGFYFIFYFYVCLFFFNTCLNNNYQYITRYLLSSVRKFH